MKLKGIETTPDGLVKLIRFLHSEENVKQINHRESDKPSYNYIFYIKSVKTISSPPVMSHPFSKYLVNLGKQYNPTKENTQKLTELIDHISLE